MKYDHPEYDEPIFEEHVPIEDLLFPDPADIYEELYPPVDYTEEEFYIAEEEYRIYLQMLIAEHEKGVTLQ